MKRVAVVGGGFAGVYAMKALHRDTNVDVTLFEPRERFVFTPLLHEVAAGVLHIPNITHSYEHIFHGRFHHIKRAVEEIDLKNNRLKAKKWYTFDYIIIATGAKTWMPKPLDVFELKSSEDALAIKDQLSRNVDAFTETKDETLLHTVVVGGGATGIELACELSSCYRWLHNSDQVHAARKVTVIQPGDILAQADDALRKKVETQLKKREIEIIDGLVEDVREKTVVMKDRKIHAGLVVWTAGVVPHAPTIDVTLDKGHIPRTKTLQVPGHTFAFAVGDVASQEKFAQRATQEGAHAAKNILRLMRGKQSQEFTYKSKGFLLSLGQKYGVARTYGVLFSGFLAWFLWRTIYLVKFVGVRSKLRMAKEYTVRLFKRE